MYFNEKLMKNFPVFSIARNIATSVTLSKNNWHVYPIYTKLSIDMILK